ncbi:hypothetical protein JCM16106_16580 [Hydrogenophilus islandicus]|jgi:hypothetical protein|uniref:Uncharacterized protein n=1 Tax=Tepidimonas ignava TaxID=114249 RepID=A0A4R3LI28_9BURK|nr:hypothetical protein [Tepidimonas ignava]TCS99138.1 hypothetical protein EDC36_103202 [Tepidimonas ignava]TSE22777.1 hypothetical protein Tigna_00752 [Tepidimonas ignava]
MGLSVRAYAQHRGVSHTAVAKAIKAGRISVEPDGTIDPAKADAQWARNTLPSQSLNIGAKKPAAKVETPPVSTPVSTPPLETRAAAPDYQTSRAIREAYAARLAKLEFEERTGKLLNADEVKVKYFNLARLLRDRIQQIPRKVAPQIVAAVVAQPDQRVVEDLLMEAIREALEELSR